MIKEKKIKNTGSALIMVIIAFMVVIILIASLFVMAGSNTRQVASQDQGIQSYYIARSGAETTYQVLISNSALMLQYKTDDTVQNDTIEFEEGNAEISVVGYYEGSTRRIRITSTGQVKGSNVSRNAILEFNYEGNGDIKWSR